jgi:hypothetical protein
MGLNETEYKSADWINLTHSMNHRRVILIVSYKSFDCVGDYYFLRKHYCSCS